MQMTTICLCVTECHRLQHQLADTTAELSECRSQLSTCQLDLTDRQNHYDGLITARDETISQLHTDSDVLQQRVTIASLHFTC